MSKSDWLNMWGDPDESEPGDAHQSADDDQSWDWDTDSLAQAKTTGLELYLKLRSRFTQLTIPAWSHNRVIEEMLHTHDSAILTDQALCATMVFTRFPGVKAMEIVDGETIAPFDTTDDNVFD